MSEEKTFSQSELNSIISDRLNEAKNKYEKQISELTEKTSAYEKQIATFNSQIEEINKKVATYESDLKSKEEKIQNYESQSVKERIAREVGIPYELANKLSGTNEEEYKADAEFLKGLINANNVMPHKSTEPVKPESDLDAAYRQLAKRGE